MSFVLTKGKGYTTQVCWGQQTELNEKKSKVTRPTGICKFCLEPLLFCGCLFALKYGEFYFKSTLSLSFEDFAMLFDQKILHLNNNKTWGYSRKSVWLETSSLQQNGRECIECTRFCRRTNNCYQGEKHKIQKVTKNNFLRQQRK